MFINPLDMYSQWMAMMLNVTLSTTIRAMNPYGKPIERRRNAPDHPASNRSPAQSTQTESKPKWRSSREPAGSSAPIALKIRLRVPHMVEPHMVLPRGTVLLGDLYPDNRVVIRGTQDVILESMEWDAIFDDLEAYNHFARWGQDRLDA